MIYSTAGFIAVAATKTPIILTGGVTVRPRVSAYCVSTDGTPTSDQGVRFRLARSTAAGTTTAQVPNPPDILAAVATVGVNATVEPTYAGVDMINRAFNPRATHQWVAYDPSAELIVPATAAAGMGIQCVTAGGAAGNFLADLTWRE